MLVEIGGSARSSSWASDIAMLVNRAYGYPRVSEREVRHRLNAGRPRRFRNRVLHVATRAGRPVGVMSSTLFVPWAGPGVGHWGLLAVDPSCQGSGVASALVRAAEQRIISEGLGHAQVRDDGVTHAQPA